jgi:hypothetical protein
MAVCARLSINELSMCYTSRCSSNKNSHCVLQHRLTASSVTMMQPVQHCHDDFYYMLLCRYHYSSASCLAVINSLYKRLACLLPPLSMSQRPSVLCPKCVLLGKSMPMNRCVKCLHQSLKLMKNSPSLVLCVITSLQLALLKAASMAFAYSFR